ncbi:MAG: hypothetical protein V4724_23090 [Pseudomonadota bacterium]
MNSQALARHVALLSALCVPPAHAGRPMTADDAGILDPRQCQLETWIQHDRRQTEYWAVPACNVAGHWELAAGAARVRPAGGGAGDTLALLQAKTILRAPDDGDGWALGLVLGNQFRPAGRLAGDLSANVPLTVALADTHTLLHANLGALRERDGERGPSLQATWALGIETEIGERAAVTFEGFGRQRGPAYFQLGARYTLITGRADIDISYGNRASLRGKDRFVAIGLTLCTGLD